MSTVAGSVRTSKWRLGSPRADLLLVFGVAFLARLAVAVAQRTWVHGFNPDYGVVAMNLRAGRGFSMPYEGEIAPTAMVSPLVPYVQSLFYMAFGRGPERAYNDYVLAHALLFVLNFAVHAVAMVLLYRVTVAVFEAAPGSHTANDARRAGLVAAGAAALYPPFVYYSLMLNETGWVFALLLLALWAALPTRLSPRRALLGGSALGLAALAHPTSFFAAPPLAVAIGRAGTTRARSVLLVAAFVLGCAVTTSPWLIRNAAVFHRFVPIKSNLGICMYVLNRPGATGLNWPYQHDDILPLYNDTPGPFVSKILSPELNARVAGLPEVEKQSFFFHATLRTIANRPWRYVGLSAKRLGVYLTYAFGRDNRPTYSTRRGLVYMAFFAPLALLAAVGIARGAARGREGRLVLACAGSIAAGFALLYVGDLRYKLPFELLLFPLAAVGALRWRHRSDAGRSGA